MQFKEKLLKMKNYSGANGISMTVNESNGEVSASIEETNRVRLLLGLKPLNVCTSYPCTSYLSSYSQTIQKNINNNNNHSNHHHQNRLVFHHLLQINMKIIVLMIK